MPHARALPDLALIEPEIAGNVGAILRSAACFGAGVHIVEPCGFAFSDARLKRAGMDYLAHAMIARHADRHSFLRQMAAAGRRLVLMTTAGAEDFYGHRFAANDVILFGNEGHGAPADIHAAAHVRLAIPMRPGTRSLNVSVAAGIAMAEARRQLQER